MIGTDVYRGELNCSNDKNRTHNFITISFQLGAVLFSQYHDNEASVSNMSYFKVHFTEALDLVRKRSVLVSNGFCYVPETEMRTLLHFMFKSLLTQNLALTAKTLPNLDEDERLIKMLHELDRRYTGTDDFSTADGDQACCRIEDIR